MHGLCSASVGSGARVRVQQYCRETCGFCSGKGGNVAMAISRNWDLS